MDFLEVCRRITTRTYLAACHRILTNENEYKMCNCIDIGQISKRSRGWVVEEEEDRGGETQM